MSESKQQKQLRLLTQVITETYKRVYGTDPRIIKDPKTSDADMLARLQRIKSGALYYELEEKARHLDGD